MNTSVSIPAHLVSSPWLVFSTYPTESEAVDYFSFNPHPQSRSSESLDEDEEEDDDDDDIEDHSACDSSDDGHYEHAEQHGSRQLKRSPRLRLKPSMNQVWSEDEEEVDEVEDEDIWSDGGSSFAGTSDRTLVDFEFDESPLTTPGGDWACAASDESILLPSACEAMPEYISFAHSVDTADDLTWSNSPMSLSSSSSSSTSEAHAFPLTPIPECLSVHARTMPSSSSSTSSYSSHLRGFTMSLSPLRNKSHTFGSYNTKLRSTHILPARRDIVSHPVPGERRRKELVHVDTPFPAF